MSPARGRLGLLLAIVALLAASYLLYSGMSPLEAPAALSLASLRAGMRAPAALDAFAGIAEDSDAAFAFYNVYIGPPANSSAKVDPMAIVNDQLRTLRESGALDLLHTVFYVLLGPGSAAAELAGEKMRRLAAIEDAGEIATLSRLWGFCNSHPNAKVLYFHNKGSLRPSPENTHFRTHLDCFTLNPHCISALDQGFDTCGARVSPIPHIHYPGNFWWATCRHVSQLIDPATWEQNATFRRSLMRAKMDLGMKRCQGAALGLSRWFAESWLGSVPEFKPADCLPSSLGKYYVSGYKFPASAAQFCPNLSGRPGAFGHVCGNASTMREPAEYKQALGLLRKGNQYCIRRDWLDVKSKEMYGSDAGLAGRWWKLYGL